MIDLTGEFFGRASDAFDVGDVDLEKRDFTVLAKFFFRVAAGFGIARADALLRNQCLCSRR
jgi:hypothetical protein